MRSRAFWVIDYFEEEEFTEPGVLQPIVQGLLGGLADPALPVQAAAACSIRWGLLKKGAVVFVEGLSWWVGLGAALGLF